MFILTSLLAACQSQRHPIPNIPKQLGINTPSSWAAKGRIGFFSKEHGGSLGFNLVQKADSYELRFFSPSGSQVGCLAGNNSQVRLFHPDGRIEAADKPENLLNKHLGWSVPLEGMRYWVLGQTMPHSRYNPISKKISSSEGLIQSFEQLGWKISFDNYQERESYLLPARLTLIRPELKVKIVINKWAPL